MSLYTGKKILILGGTPSGSTDVVEYLKENGAQTIVAGYFPIDRSPAKQIADECWDISTSEVTKICDKARAAQVDGVFAGIHDFNLQRAIEVCNRLHLPCYTSQDQLEKTLVKSYYKKLFREFDVPVVPEFKIKEGEIENSEPNIDYPVLIKPVDATAGQGISICHNKKELKKGFKEALSYSNRKEIIIEKYIEAPEATIYYVLQDGTIMLTAMADRYTENGDAYTIPLPVLYTFPSKHLNTYIESLNDKVIAALQSIGLKNGMLFIQTFIDEKGFQFYDMGYRLSATQEYRFIEEICGFNPLKMMVDYSVTGKMGRKNIEKRVDPGFNGKQACNITFLAEPCTIERFIGLEEIKKMPGVIKFEKNHLEGDTIPPSATGTLIQVVIRIFAIVDTKEAMKSLIKEIDDTFDVISTTGKSVKMPLLDLSEI